MSHDIDRIQQRVRRYWADDGLAEMAAGGLCIFIGLLSFAEASAPPGSSLARILAIGLPVLTIAGILLVGRVIGEVKARLTYPRTGYVAYRGTPAARRVLAGLASGMIGAAMVNLLRSWQVSPDWTPGLTGVSISLFLLYLGHTLGLMRFHILAMLSALTGAAVSLGGLGDTRGSAV